MPDTHAVTFTQDELWLLRMVVKHDAAVPWQGKWPAYSLDLNDAICEAIVLCHYQELGNIEAAEVMGVSVEALEGLLGRGRRALRLGLADMMESAE